MKSIHMSPMLNLGVLGIAVVCLPSCLPESEGEANETAQTGARASSETESESTAGAESAYPSGGADRMTAGTTGADRPTAGQQTAGEVMSTGGLGTIESTEGGAYGVEPDTQIPGGQSTTTGGDRADSDRENAVFGGLANFECVPTEEVCNRRDDDCDEAIDEEYDDLNELCTVGIGRCERTGLLRCTRDGEDTECSAKPGEPLEEMCNGADDDCDGETDEGFPELRTPCTTGVGACQTIGVRTCSPDGINTICNAEVVPPQAERCNGLDDDCDGLNDESFADLNQLCAVGQGACLRAGVRACAPDGLSVMCSAQDGMGMAEICNGVDDDCDSAIDEAFPNIGQLCEVGLGICRRSGIVTCTDDGTASRCNADIVVGRQETCDYQDDDCDGRTDESYTDANDRYTTLTHCGGCGNDCRQLWNPSPEANGVQPTCIAVGATATCGFDCLEGFRDADGIAGNGCEFREDPSAVYVATPANGGIDANDCGAWSRPCSTINLGINIAFNDMGKTKVLVSDGLYRETVILRAGIDVLGGHNRVNWNRNPEINSTIIRANDPSFVHAAAVYAIDIDQETILDGFAIEGETPSVGNSYGVFVRDSDDNLHITNNRIRAGDGARGADGIAGRSGTPGTPGQAGRNAFSSAQNGNQCLPNIRIQAGGLGGSQQCDDVSASGGQGGSSFCPALNRSSGNGEDGDGGQLGGQGGFGGGGLNSTEPGRCLVSESAANGRNEPTGATGATGARGTDGQGGQGALSFSGQLDILTGHWEGQSGIAGVHGIPGGGGGGGGASAGIDINWTASNDIGSTGGGGGSGGCGGTGAQGGTAGGGSFAVFISFTGAGPDALTAFPRVENNELSRGFAGPGGAGGIGGAGGEGGQAGPGGLKGADENLLMPFCIFEGGDGGPGGRGGHGGGGGGGQGGNSYDLFIGNANGLSPEYVGENIFPIPSVEFTGGRGGGGGNSSNTALGLGTDGVAGASGHLGIID